MHHFIIVLSPPFIIAQRLKQRKIQGRANDVAMLLAVSAKRAHCGDDRPCAGTSTVMDEDAATLVKSCSRLIRLSHTFFWAATPTASNGLTTNTKAAAGSGRKKNGDAVEKLELTDLQTDPLVPLAEAELAAIGPLLLGPRGLASLVSAGELEELEMVALRESGLPPSQYSYIVLAWACTHAMQGVQEGLLIGGAGFEQELLRQFTSLRAEYFSIGDYTAGRMPLAYVHLVQVPFDALFISF